MPASNGKPQSPNVRRWREAVIGVVDAMMINGKPVLIETDARRLIITADK